MGAMGAMGTTGAMVLTASLGIAGRPDRKGRSSSTNGGVTALQLEIAPMAPIGGSEPIDSEQASAGKQGKSGRRWR